VIFWPCHHERSGSSRAPPSDRTGPRHHEDPAFGVGAWGRLLRRGDRWCRCQLQSHNRRGRRRHAPPWPCDLAAQFDAFAAEIFVFKGSVPVFGPEPHVETAIVDSEPVRTRSCPHAKCGFDNWQSCRRGAWAR
jgi:hypothetical protein